MDFRALLFWNRRPRGPACPRCGFKADIVKAGVRERFRIDAEAWSDRCLARADANPPKAPFDCPHLKAVLHPHRPDAP